MNRVLIACSPKSGSTYTAKVLACYLEAERLYPQEYAGYREQNILPQYFEASKDKSIVTQLHVMPNEPNLERIKALDLQTVVLRRNVADSLVSLDDHIRLEDHRTPACFIRDRSRYLALSMEDRIQYLIRYATPWYIAFYLAWKDRPVVKAFYRKLALDKQGFFAGILTDLGIALDRERLAGLLHVEMQNTRFNQGRFGRSLSVFTRRNWDLLLGMLSEHPEDLRELISELPCSC